MGGCVGILWVLASLRFRVVLGLDLDLLGRKVGETTSLLLEFGLRVELSR